VGLWAAAFTLILTSIALPADGQNHSSTATKFLSQGDKPLTHYRALRRMYVRNEKFNQEAWLDAWTVLDAEGFRYEVVSERGSDYSREKVLKPLLKREQELVDEGQAERSTLSRANYEFTDAATDGDGLRYVLIKPKRKDVLLVDGRMVLNEDATELLRVEGRLAKNPSFWTNSVTIVRHYGLVDGQGQVRRSCAARRGVRLRVDQRPPRQPAGPPNARHASIAPLTSSLHSSLSP
jgi:hypothetical protein